MTNATQSKTGSFLRDAVVIADVNAWIRRALRWGEADVETSFWK
jgi:hypothetical protein